MDEFNFLFLALGLLMTLWGWKASGKGAGSVSYPLWYRILRLLCLAVIFLPCLLLTIMNPVPEDLLQKMVYGEIAALLALVLVPAKSGKKNAAPVLSEEEMGDRKKTEWQKAILLGAAVTVLMWIAFLYLI
ncbi:hypothetical protein [uncultured Dialister sp.]|jgi:4-amino-4-deoxy-L-arabinose transferase-like glycosyltransferase|uniref:hypothetical protein n=1 Tax=Dialister sp. TaxID=1955814 RepID=UPI0025CD4FEC|nr:hypothetical protein [uncultured Dialister sp.]